MKTYYFTVLTILLVSCAQPKKVFTEADINIIPKPLKVELKKGSFTFTKNTVIVVSEEEQKIPANVLINKIKKATGWNLPIVSKKPNTNFVYFKKEDTLKEESYHLIVNTKDIQISSKGLSGWLYGVYSLLQLLPENIESSKVVSNEQWIVPEIVIEDAPRFKWRGLMLDVSRHFFKKEYILKTIDRLAFLKMNTLHLHLMDDQGWRIEIKKYPKLTEVGAWRVDQEDKHWNAKENNKPSDKATYGGFYTQKDIKEIVAYAKKRGVTVVPEIEMPAHIMSAIAAYPELSCLGKPIAVPSGGVWPITDIYCAGNEKTFAFLEDVLTEVMELFPSKYIHIGGDEATKTNWKKCPKCQKRMKTEHLKNENELQSYFIKRIEKFINFKGRKLIGWDEILEGGLAPQATVMSWRGVKGGLEASEQGHDVVMTPGTHCYFDHYQGSYENEPLAIGGYTPLSKVYQFDPVVESMSKEQIKHVLGGQANLWSEYIPTESHSEYMLFPRLIALSETLWSKKEFRNWEDFSHRIQAMFPRLDVMKINYAKSAKNVTLFTKVDEKDGSISVLANTEFPNSDIRYSTDGGVFKKYTSPIKIDKTIAIKASLFEGEKSVGKLASKTFTFHKGVGKKVSYTVPPHKKYKGTNGTLVNILKGSTNFTDGKWQGWNHKTPEITVDLGKLTNISKVAIGCLESQGSWIFFPEKVEVWISKEGKKYEKVGQKEHPYQLNGYTTLKDFTITFKSQQVRYVKTKATYANHKLKGVDSWVFIDEIIVE